MELYNPLIKSTLEQLSKSKSKTKSWGYDISKSWADVGSSELVLQSEAAYELGALGLGSSNYNCVTTSADLVNKDQVILYGPDLKEIKKDTAFARIVLLRVGDIEGDDDEVYRALKDIEFSKYHVYPEGYMVRMSPESHREQIRVSKRAIKKGINFNAVGQRYITEYKKDRNVINVSSIQDAYRLINRKLGTIPSLIQSRFTDSMRKGVRRAKEERSSSEAINCSMFFN